MEDYDFIIRIIQYLESNFGIRFFISTRDFDVLYRWWERRIPLRLVMESIASVVRRRREKNRDIRGFTTLTTEVKKNYRSFLEMNAGESGTVEKDIYSEIDDFMKHFPPELAVLQGEFLDICRRVKKHQDFTLERIQRKLLDMFASDRDLNLKTRFFLESIARELRKPEMERKYRINYLLHKFRIPDFDIYRQ
jgi:hypothetical protein